MKRKFFWSMLTIFMVTLLCVGFTSCGDDDDDTNIAVGTWVKEEGRRSYTFTFRSNGSGTVVYKYEDSYSGTETDSEKFSYTITGKNEGTMYHEYHEGSSKEVIYFVIDGKHMFLYFDKNYDEYIMELTKQK